MEKRIPRGFFAVFTMIAVAFALCLGTASPAFAANTPAQGGTMTFKKYLVMDANANVPNVTFKFTIEPGAAQSASAGGLAIYAGVGAPTVSTAIFGASDDTTEGIPGNIGDTTHKYVEKAVIIDFDGISFDKLGIYRYTITEEASSHDGITNDTARTRTLDVYVTYADNSSSALKVSRYVLYKGTEDQSEEAKSDGFTNEYATNNLTLKKQVTGNQGDRDKYFEFTVSITGAAAGTVYGVNLDNADKTPTVGDQSKNNPDTLTVGEGGSVLGTFYLKHGQSIIIQGLTPGTDYTITEASYSADGYTTTNTVDSKDSEEGLTTDAQNMGGKNHEVVFTNNKEGVVPTGILLETGPFILLGAVVLAALIALLATGRRCARR